MYKTETWHWLGGGAALLAWLMWRKAQVELLWLMNSMICFIVMWSCVCRFAVMDCKATAWEWRERYVLIFFAAACGVMAPWLLDERPGFMQILTWLALLRLIEVNGDGWRHGVPTYARTDSARFRVF